MSEANHDPDAIVRRWEEASAYLDNSLQAYLHACSTLETHSGAMYTSKITPITKISHRIGSGHVAALQLLQQSHASMTRARNILSSRIYSFPDEVLCTVFSIMIYEPTNEPAIEPVTRMKERITIIRERLNTLLIVCSTWRRTLLSNSSFWAMIPFINGEGYGLMSDAIRLGLQRSRNAPLHLAVHLEACKRKELEKGLLNLGNHWARIQRVNICSGSREDIRTIMRLLLGHTPPDLITELSICYNIKTRDGKELPEEDDYLFPRDSGHQALLEGLMESIHTLRLSKIDIYLDNVSFQGLVELRIEDIMLGYNSDLHRLLYALSSAPELRIMELIDVITLSDPTHADEEIDWTMATLPPPRSFPRLEILHLQDLYFDVIQLVLRLAIPRTCQLVLHLTERFLRINNNTGASRSLNEFRSMLTGVNARVDTLMVGFRSMDWLGGATGLRKILQVMPKLKTLYLHWWELDRMVLGALTRPRRNSAHSATDSEPLTFPSLEHVYLTGVRLHDYQSFKKFVLSHPIERLVLASAQPGCSPEVEDDDWISMESHHMIPVWLKTTIPNFQLLNSVDELPEFDPWTWQLW